MTLFSIALRNIRRNFYDYFLYFLSMIFSILIYFTFVSIKYNEQVLRLGEVRQRIAAGFTSSSVILAIFAFILSGILTPFSPGRGKGRLVYIPYWELKRKRLGECFFTKIL